MGWGRGLLTSAPQRTTSQLGDGSLLNSSGSSGPLQKWDVNSAGSMATGNALPGQRGVWSAAKLRFLRKALRRRECCLFACARDLAKWPGRAQVGYVPQSTAKMRDTKLGFRRPAAGPAAGWAASGRTALTGSRTPQMYREIGLDDVPRSRRPAWGHLNRKPDAAWS